MTHTVTNKPFGFKSSPGWDVIVDGKPTGVVRQKDSSIPAFTGIYMGKVYGPFPSLVQAVDAVADRVLGLVA